MNSNLGLHYTVSGEWVSNQIQESRPDRANRQRYGLAKRVLDIMLCLALMPLALVLMAVMALAIRLDSRGPILFIQERVGQGGRRFQMYKFRTLEHNSDDPASREFMKAFVSGQIGQEEPNPDRLPYKPKARVTRVGRILRKTSLDELPQIFNVLRGEMSLVGPRPNVPWEVEAYQEWHKERLEVLPGITGLAQVRGRSSIPFDVIVSHDIEYIRQQSLKLDVQILWRTVRCVLSRRGSG